MKTTLMFVMLMVSFSVFSQSVKIPTETLKTEFDSVDISGFSLQSHSLASLNLLEWGEGKLLINLNISIPDFYAMGARTLNRSVNLNGIDDGMGAYDVLDNHQRIVGKLNVFHNVIVMYLYDKMLCESLRFRANTTLEFKKGKKRVCYNRKNKEIECPRIIEIYI